MEMTIKTWQPPSSSKQKKGSTPKLRLSCDNCSQAKVRCDHERPSCQRCTHAGVRCVYSVSRRIGKPPRSAKNSEAGATKNNSNGATKKNNTSSSIAVQTESVSPPSTTSASTASTAPTIDSTLDGFPDYNMPDIEPLSSDFLMSLEDDLGFRSLPSYHDSLNNIAQAHGLQKEMLNTLSSGLGQWNLHSAFHSGIDASNPANHMDGMSSCPSTLPASAEAAGNPAGQTHDGRTPCVQLTSSTLHSLSLPFNFCTTSASAAVPPVTIDHVLDTSRQAMAALYTLLQCSCAQSCSSALSIALIILKVLDSYGAIARSSSSNPSPPLAIGTGSTRSASSSGNSTREISSESVSNSQTPSKASTPPPGFSSTGQHMVLDTPITIGVYTIRGEDEHWLILHLLLSELRRVERLVEAFGRRYRGDVFHGALEHFLRSRVYATRGELNAVLSWE